MTFSSDYPLLDALRIFIAAGALWLALLVLKLGWRRWRHPERDQPNAHPFTYLSYAAALFSIGGFRVAKLGEPFDIRIPITFAIVVLGIIGVTRRVRFNNGVIRRVGFRHE